MCSSTLKPSLYGQTFVAKCCLNWIFFMAPSIVVLCTQIWNIKMRSSKIINKNIAQKVMTKYDFKCRFKT